MTVRPERLSEIDQAAAVASEAANEVEGEIREFVRRDISVFRRNLQREHLKRMASTLLRPSQTMQADARALQRENAKELLALIKGAKTKPSFSKEARAHLAECENSLEEALKAPLQRPGV